MRNKGRLSLQAATLCALSLAAAGADSLYKYRDANGHLVYSDRKPDAAADVQSIAIGLESKAPRIDVQIVSTATDWKLQATNECLCSVEFEVRIADARNLPLPNASVYHQLLAPKSSQALVDVSRTAADGTPSVRLSWKGILGVPGVRHAPRMPYRAPFAIGSSYLITQAYPLRITHTSAGDQYAVDIALPDGTPVYAAREGTVINVRHDSYRGAATAVMIDQANMVEILHDDGTIADYAHLHWDSVRVQPGQVVHRGEYLANSGNTGFSTGPHLHFAVIRNAGMSAESVPIEFLGASGTSITPRAQTMLTAY